jgi:small subunit ribosomal protein S14
MAKLSDQARTQARKLVAKYAKKYAELKAIANDAKKSDEERYAGPSGAAEAARATRTRPACATVAS